VVPPQFAIVHIVVLGQSMQAEPSDLHCPLLPQVLIADAVHAVWQHTVLTQWSLAHSPSTPHEVPSVLPVHVVPWHIVDRQSPPTEQPLPLAQVLFPLAVVAHEPPQSVSVSSPSLTPSMHETHVMVGE
jgi:hypothetical protein